MLVQTRKQFDAVVDQLAVAKRVAVDTETNGLKVHQGHRLCGVSVHFELKGGYVLSAYFPFRHAAGDTLFNLSENLPLEWLGQLGAVLGRSDLFTIWHNVKFDFGFLAADGIWIKGNFFCTMIGSTLVDENAKHDLGACEHRYLGTTTKKDTSEKHLKPYLKGKKDYSKVPPADMEVYANNDTRLTFRIYPHIAKEMQKQELLPLWPSDSEFVRCLFDLEWNGLFIDRPLAERLSAEAEARMRTLEDEMGFDPQKRPQLADKLFAAPPDGLGLPAPKILTSDTSPRFPQGLPKMDNENLVPLADMDPLIGRVLEYRGLVKANSTWYRGFLRAAGDTDRIHPVYNTGGAVEKYGARTSRLTCSGPNIQQLPRDPKKYVRKLLLPPEPGWMGVEEWVLVEWDYNQIEYRLGGLYAEEPAIVDAYRQGVDMHQVTADKMGIPRVSPTGGLDGKKLNFTLFYRGGPERAAALVGGSLEEGKEIHSAFWAGYPKLRKFIYECEREAKRKGYVKLWDGHRRHFAHVWECHKAFNSVIQGGVARIVQRTMTDFYRMPNIDFKTVYQIHDALGFYVPKVTRESNYELIRKTMEWPGEYFGLDFPVEWKEIHNDK